VTASLDYLLHLADNALVLGQRNAEWCANGPVLEEDIALANISLDLIGQARFLYQAAAALMNAGLPATGALATEDTLAYFRDAHEFRNYSLLELPHSISPGGERDYAVAIVRNFLYSALMVLLWEALQKSNDAPLAAIAERSLKETRYHLRHSRDWLIRLGDGTEDSHARTQAALNHLMPYTLAFWAESAAETAAAAGSGLAMPALRDTWMVLLKSAITTATLKLPEPKNETREPLPQGKNGQHSEHLKPLLDEMQSLARQHPGATW
jgi:ring-1,2-phenylacetyl-CoA epoxidase subunit PaaC